MQDIVGPIKDEMLAKFVVDSHFKSQPEGANKEDKSGTDFQDEFDPSAMPLDTDVSRSPFLISPCCFENAYIFGLFAVYVHRYSLRIC